MRIGVLLALSFAIGCSKGDHAPAASNTGSGSGSGAPTSTKPVEAVPPGFGAPLGPTPTDEGHRILPPQRFRHSSVRGDFRVYKTAAGIVVSWKTVLSARTVDGKPMWKKDDQGRAVAVSSDGARIVTNNNDGELLVLDAKTGAPLGAPAQLGGRGDTTHADVWVSAFAWMPDGKHILALDSKHVYLLDGAGALQKELPIKCKEDCFFTAAVGVTNDEAIIANTPGSSSSQLVRIKIADGSIVTAADVYGQDPDLGAQRTALVVDGLNNLALVDATTLAARWTAPRPGLGGVKFSADASGWTEWKSLPKLSPDGKHVVVNDQAGRLWILDAKDGRPLLAYPTDLVDFVEDVIWLDGENLIAIDNPGRVMRIAGTPAKIVWTEMDGPEGGEWDDP
jgi:hypothetical protein